MKKLRITLAIIASLLIIVLDLSVCLSWFDTPDDAISCLVGCGFYTTMLATFWLFADMQIREINTK